MGVTWPLTGRDEELGRTVASLREGRGVILAGASGVGKTRLWQEAADLAAAREGSLVVRAVGTGAAASIPFGALAGMLPAPPDPGSPLDELLGRLTRLRGLAGEHHVVLAVDDAHLLDDASAAFLRHVAGEGLAALLLTARSGEPAPEPVVGLWKDGVVDRMELQPLSRSECDTLAATALGGTVDGRTLAWLWEATDGNALFLREMITAGVETAALTHDGLVWRWRGRPRSTPRLADVLRDKIARLDACAREAAEITALGQPLSLGILVDLTSAEAVAAAEEHGLVRTERDGRRLVARGGHPLHGALLLETAPPTRIRTSLLRLVEAVERRGGRREGDTIQLGLWLLEAGDASRPDVLTRAAERARAGSHPHLAERLARAAIAAGAGFEARVVLRRVLGVVGKYDEAEDVLPATEWASTGGALASVAMSRADAFLVGFGAAPEVEEALGAAAAAVHDPDAADELATMALVVRLFGGEDPAAVVAAAEAMFARERLGPVAFVRASLAAVPALAVAGRPLDALAVAERAGTVLSGLRDALPFGDLQLGAGRILALLLSGRFADAGALCAAHYDAAVERRQDFARAAWATQAGQVEMWRGHPLTAALRLREGLALMRAVDVVGARTVCRAALAAALAWSGNTGDAQALLDGLDSARSPELRLFEPFVSMDQALAALCAGHVSAAEEHAAAAAAMAAARGQLGLEALALHLGARIRPSEGAAARLAAISGASGDAAGELLPLVARHARALVSGAAAELEAVAAEFAALGAPAVAAEAFHQAALAHRHAAVAAGAHRCLAAAGTLAARCEAPPPLPLERASLPDLTRREQEVARLAAQGFTNREVAERLYVSVRTVHTHLQSAYAKLDVHDREGLREVLPLSGGNAANL